MPRRSIGRLEERAEAWHIAKFGLASPDASATYWKLMEEVGEVGEAMMEWFQTGDPTDEEMIDEELGDALLVLLHLIRWNDMGSLYEVLDRAITKCEQRLKLEQGKETV